MTKVYIAGPMSGIPQFNYPMFFDVAKSLREQGFEVMCPAEMDSPEMQELALASEEGNLAELADSGETWGDVLAKDVKIVADEVDGVVMLPGWENSRGARLEAFVALNSQKKVWIWQGGLLGTPSKTAVVAEIMHGVLDQGDVSRYAEG